MLIEKGGVGERRKRKKDKRNRQTKKMRWKRRWGGRKRKNRKKKEGKLLEACKLRQQRAVTHRGSYVTNAFIFSDLRAADK